jgi:chromosome segregation ATPase
MNAHRKQNMPIRQSKPDGESTAADSTLTVDVPPPFQPVSVQPDKLRETLTRYAKERKQLVQQVSESYCEIEQLKTALRQEKETRQQLEEKLKDVMTAGIEHVRHEISGDSAAQEANIAALKQQIEERDSQLRESTARLEEAKTALAAGKGAPAKESEQLQTRETEARLQSVTNDFEKQSGELLRLQSERQLLAKTNDELETRLHTYKDRDTAHQTELAEAERRVRDGVGTLARVTADLERERADRRRIEERGVSLAAQVESMHGQLRQHLESERENQNKIARLETELRERETTVTQLQSDLQKTAIDLSLAEEQLKTTAQMSKEFEDSLRIFEEARQVFLRTEEQLTSRVETSGKALSEAEAKLQTEAGARVELAKALEELQRQLEQETEKSALELSRLQAAVEVEKLQRKQLEGTAVQARYASIDSARADRVLLARLRTRTRGPMEELLSSTRRLLENDLPEDRKKLVETVLEQALLLKSNFHGASDAEPIPAELTPQTSPVTAKAA